MVVEMLVMEVTNMNETIIKEIEQQLLRYLDNAQMEQLHKTLKHCLDNIEIKVKDDEMNEISKLDLGRSEIVDHSDPAFVKMLHALKIHK